MATLIYSPGVRCYIDTEKNGILDVSEDLCGTATMVRRVDGVSTWDFTLMNSRRKYDGVFTPNDRTIVMMKRITWLRTFSGLLNTVPLKTIWPQEVPISSSCTLKRLQYFYWDPANVNTQTMISAALSNGTNGEGGTPEGGVINALMAILTKVAGWPSANVHIGKIPDDWYKIALKIAQRVDSDVTASDAARQDYLDSINPGAIFGGSSAAGTSPATTGTTSDGGLLLGSSGFVGTLQGQTFNGTTLDDAQRLNAELIVSTCWDILNSRVDSSGAQAKGLICAIMTAMTESGLRNLPSQAVPESLNYSHDTYPDGTVPSGDHDSVGLFQQRAGWGSVAERMNPNKSAALFINALLDKGGWQKMANGSLCQAVQVSAYPDRYAKYEQMATAMVTEMISNYSSNRAANKTTTGKTSRVGARTSTKSKVQASVASRTGQATGRDLVGEALNLVERYPNIPYTQQYGGTQLGVLSKEPPPGLDCSSFVQAVMLRTLGNLGGCPRTSSAQASWCRRITTEQAMNTPGALLFKSSNGKTSGVFHVEVSLGDGTKAVGAHRSGVPAGVDSSGAPYWSFGGLIPSLVYGSAGSGGGATQGATSQTVGGTGHYPITPHPINCRYGKPGDWAAGHHTGVDFDAVPGTPVTSVAPGFVVSADASAWGADYGNHVVIQVGDFQVGYCHLKSFDAGITTGATVDTGSAVGLSGNTGRTTGPHLHFEVRKAPYAYGDDVDPIVFITAGMQSETSVTGAVGATGTSSGGYNESEPGILDFPLASELPGYDPEDPIDQLFGDNMWAPVFGDKNSLAISSALTGVRALLNDTPMLPYLKNLFYSTMRSFCSAPNGDIIGWFPDYYGLWGIAAKLRLEPIEMMDFNVFWSDDQFVTHQFTQAGKYNSLDLSEGSVETALANDLLQATTTVGIANIDMPELLESLFGVEPGNAQDFATWIYGKFGARPNFYPAQGLVGPKAELFSAIHMFMIQWTYQYRADVPVTFMPEAWPGMLLQVPKVDFQAYITTVTHTITFGEGGGYQTNLNLAAPAYMPRGGQANKDHALFGLPLAGGYHPGRGIGNPAPEAYAIDPIPPVPELF